MERSARGTTSVLTSLLNVWSGCTRGVKGLTEALLEMVWGPSRGAVTVMVRSGAVTGGGLGLPGVGAGGAARLARVQVTVVVTPVVGQLQPVPPAPTSVTPDGRVSLTVTVEAALGPAFLTLSV